MNVLVVTLCFVAGTCVNIARLVRLTRVNEGFEIPLLFGRPVVRPNGDRRLSILAVLLYVPGISELQRGDPMWCFFAIIPIIVTTFPMLLRHNLAVRRSGRREPVGQAREE